MSDASTDSRVKAIAKKLRTAAKGNFTPFGVEDHHFRLQPPLGKRDLAAIEKQYQIEFPTEYRAFVTTVANGGAGPAYGLFSLQESLTTKTGALPHDLLATQFPYTEAYNPDDSTAEIPFQHQAAGMLPLCHEGCGYMHILIVTGPARGQMWMDGRVSDQGFAPLDASFLDWYERWLDSVLAGGEGTWWMG